MNNLTIKNARKLFVDKKISSHDLVKYYLERIDKYDNKLNSYLTVNEKALEKSRNICKPPDKNKPLLGIPIAIKDIFLSKKLRTTAASKLLDDYVPMYSATVVERLENAGAIILGKTNLDAWCHGSSTETSDYGPTLNPWNSRHLSGGSSGGSAAAVSADLCTAAIGTETAGSVRGPAAWCGVVGFKPTYGRVSRYGVIAMGSSLDSPGPITKSVEDASLLLRIIAGKDEYDATTSDISVDNYLNELKKKRKNLRIAFAKNYLLKNMDDRAKKAIIDTTKVFKKIGAEVREIITLDPRYAIGVYTIIQRSEVSSNLSRFDGIRFGKDRNYFGQEAKRRIMLGTFTLSSGYQDKYYKKAQKVRTLFINDFKRIFENFDLIITPTMPGPAPKIGATKNQAMFGEMADILSEAPSIAGLPSISVPCGFVDGLPIGLSIIGPQFSEKVILKAAYLYERFTDWKNFKPNLENL